MFFPGFNLEIIDLSETRLRVRHGGAGPPVLLLHGHPRTHATWHRVAPLLAKRHTVVCPDLRGFGQSSKPPDRPIIRVPQNAQRLGIVSSL
jgi:haloacetate dehalogenase